MAASPRAPAAFSNELRSLIATQKKNYRDYLTVLGGERNDRREKDDDDRFDLYRKLEIDGRERIVGTERKPAVALPGASPDGRSGPPIPPTSPSPARSSKPCASRPSRPSPPPGRASSAKRTT